MAFTDGTNLEFHSNRIPNRITSKFRIRIEYRFEYEYSVASNSIRILAQVRAGVVGIVAIRIDLFVCLLSDLKLKLRKQTRAKLDMIYGAR